ncbi:predicted protein [Postia placenta Mad-698-R]|nr:predicted protein [Postia placenta Mad-698-R]
MTDVSFTSLFIDGKQRPANPPVTFDVRNPYSNAVVTKAASASAQDCKDAVEAAARAFTTWETSSYAERRDYFFKAAELVTTDKYFKKFKEAFQEETAGVDTLVYLNVYGTAAFLRNTATFVAQLKGETFPSVVPGGQVLVQRRPQGVILAVAPWNVPLVLTLRAVGIPIVCGNTVVLKTSEVSPRTQFVIAELFEEAGFPAGVLNVIHTSAKDAPARTAELIAHSAVKKINFTGSDRVGRILAQEAGKYLKPCVFELGGKAPAVVLDDADVERAARAITSSSLLHSGQTCMSTQRIIVQRNVAPRFKQVLAETFSKFKSGQGEALSAQYSEAAAESIVAALGEAKAAGATFLVGDGTRKGACVQPHLVTGVEPGTRLWDRETFGPVAVIKEVDTVDEAVELANASEYSLAASVWTQDVNNAIDVSARIRAGSVSVNGPTFHLEQARELGGLSGASGYGNFSVEEFTDQRIIVIHPAKAPEYMLTG